MDIYPESTVDDQKRFFGLQNTQSNTMNAIPALPFDPEGQQPAEKSALKQDDKGEIEDTKVAVEEVEE